MCGLGTSLGGQLYRGRSREGGRKSGPQVRTGGWWPLESEPPEPTSRDTMEKLEPVSRATPLKPARTRCASLVGMIGRVWWVDLQRLTIMAGPWWPARGPFKYSAGQGSSSNDMSDEAHACEGAIIRSAHDLAHILSRQNLGVDQMKRRQFDDHWAPRFDWISD